MKVVDTEQMVPRYQDEMKVVDTHETLRSTDLDESLVAEVDETILENWYHCQIEVVNTDETIRYDDSDECVVVEMDEMILENWFQGEMEVVDTGEMVPSNQY